MTKTLLAACAALMLVVSSAKADDLMEFDLDSITDADISIEEVSFDIDVEALEAETDDGLMSGNGDELEEAIGACFRRFGYGRRGFGGYHGYRGWGGYNNFHCYRPVYRSCYYNSCYRPIVRHCVTPIYRHYWGCH